MKLDQSKSNPLFAVAMQGGEWLNQHSIDAIITNLEPDNVASKYKILATDAARHALYSWYVEHDLTTAKQWFYVAAKCIAISTTKPVGYAKLWTCHDFMFPLLSDNPELIALYATLETPNLIEKRDNPKEGEFQVNLVQTALKGDYSKLAELITLLKAKGLKKDAKYDNAYIQFFTGLINGNIADMEAGLAVLGKCQSQNPTTEDFFAFHAVVLCKLAWLKGYQVQVDSPLVPMEFMPVAPLAHYDDVYEFLKPGWQAPLPPAPPKPGLLARLFGK